MLNENQKNYKGGVKTEAGKAISKYNAQKHCILRETPTDYEQADVSMIFDSYCEDLKPENVIQETIIEMMVNNVIKLSRIAKAENETIKEVLSPHRSAIDAWLEMKREYVPIINYEAIEKLNLLSRYQTATENRFYRALQAFKQMKHE